MKLPINKMCKPFLLYQLELHVLSLPAQVNGTGERSDQVTTPSCCAHSCLGMDYWCLHSFLMQKGKTKASLPSSLYELWKQDYLTSVYK